MIQRFALAVALVVLGSLLTVGPLRAVAGQTDAPMDIELRLGGGFQSTTYSLNNNALSYLHSNGNQEVRKSAALSGADHNDLARLMGEFDIRRMKSNSPAGPDETYYQLRISQNGGQTRLYCWMPDNSCHGLSERLKGLFDTILARSN